MKFQHFGFLSFVLLCSIANANMCTQWSTPQKVGLLDTGKLKEASGLAISKTFPDRMYHHNDSRAPGVFYITDMTGGNTREIRFTNEKVTDVEDMSIGPCDSGQCVFLGDIGDNKAVRKSVSLWVFPEVQEFIDVPSIVKKIVLHYPDGGHNAESLAVHPITGDVYILTKEASYEERRSYPAFLFRLPRQALNQKSAILELVGKIDLPWMNYNFGIFGGMATSMDISPDGKTMLVLTYENAIEINIDKVLGESPETRKWKEDHDYRILPLRGLLYQQEAVTYSPDGNSIYFDSEFSKDSGEKDSPIYRADCLAH